MGCGDVVECGGVDYFKCKNFDWGVGLNFCCVECMGMWGRSGVWGRGLF